MRISTSDGSFGFVVEHTRRAKFMVFQVIIEGYLIGDSEPCILGTALHQLTHLAKVALGPPGAYPGAAAVLSKLRSRDEWSDATLLPLAESLDGWSIRGYVDRAKAVFVAQPNDNLGESPVLRMTVVDLDEYTPMVSALRAYWETETS